MRMVEGFAREKGLKRMSVATFPERFARMFEILRKGGWNVAGDEVEGKAVLVKDVVVPEETERVGEGNRERRR
jgi:hypothetical protein